MCCNSGCVHHYCGCCTYKCCGGCYRCRPKFYYPPLWVPVIPTVTTVVKTIITQTKVPILEKMGFKKG